MGNCCGAPNTSPVTGVRTLRATQDDGKQLTIYGDYFDVDTRTIVSLLSLCNIKYKLKEINTFNGDHIKNEEFKKLNPTSSVPLIKDNRFKILGSTSVFLKYLANAKQKSGMAKYWPEGCRGQIENSLKWYEAVLRPACRLVLSHYIGGHLFGFPEADP